MPGLAAPEVALAAHAAEAAGRQAQAQAAVGEVARVEARVAVRLAAPVPSHTVSTKPV